MVQWWECSPPCTNVARVCCWFSSLLQEVFLWVLRFFPLLKNQNFQIPIRLTIKPGEEPLWGCATSKSLFLYFFIISKFDSHPLKLVKINGQSSKLQPHWDTLFSEVLKGRFGRGVPPRHGFRPWPRLKTKIVHFATLFIKEILFYDTIIRSFFSHTESKYFSKLHYGIRCFGIKILGSTYGD